MPTATTTPNAKYVSGGVPFGGYFANFYRPADPASPTLAAAVSLGRYRVETHAPSDGATLTKRPDIDGGQNGWFIIGMDTEGQLTLQRNVATTPTIQNGDFHDFVSGFDSGGNPIIARAVSHGINSPQDPSYRKQSFSTIVDQSAPDLQTYAQLNPLSATP